jgi:hypothetical protein
MQSDVTSPEQPLTPDVRGAEEILLGALAGSALMPFLQAIATDAGHGVYTKIRSLLSGNSRTRASSDLEKSGTVTLVDPDRRIVLTLPERLAPEQAASLSNILMSTSGDWRLVDWDVENCGWRVTASRRRPLQGLDVTEHSEISE